MNKTLTSTGNDVWATPQKLFNEVSKMFDFDLDVAADLLNSKCENFFTKEQDGLQQDWFESSKTKCVWMNPPYSKVKHWINKAAAEQKKGCTVVALLAFRPDTIAWFDHIWKSQEFGLHHVIANDTKDHVQVYPIKGRLRFGNAKNPAPFPSVVVVFRGHK